MFSPAGSGSELGNRDGSREYRNCQFMTPETRRTTHFFWTYLNNYEGSDANISRSLHQSLIEGFLEDKHLIEAQQQQIDADPTFELQAVAADAALSHFSAGSSAKRWPGSRPRLKRRRRPLGRKPRSALSRTACPTQGAARKPPRPHQVGMS